MVDIPLGLRHALEGGRCVLFLGAGVGRHLKRADSTSAPDGAELAKLLAEHFGIEADGWYDLAQIAQAVQLRKGRKELETFVQSHLRNLEPDESFRWLFSRRWSAIYTTNYDNAIERAYELNATPPQTPVVFSATHDLLPYEPHFQVPVIHLHGSLFGTEDPRIVITEDDYVRFRERRKMLFELLKRDAATATILYVGYSHRDPNWRLTLDELAAEFLPRTPPQAYRVAPSTGKLESDILKSRGVETISSDLEGFVRAASACLTDTSVDADFITRAQKSVPSELLPLFDENAPATMRLLNSWTYVNQAQFSEPPNLRLFLRGDRPNWALVGAHKYFVRDLEESMFDSLLDFATSSDNRSVVDVLLGPAGFGTSTLLATLAVRLVQERAGMVFFLRAGARVLDGDVEFVASMARNQRVFLFVDDAGDQREAVESSERRQRAGKLPVMFMLGSRLNEWRQTNAGRLGTEFEIGELSDPEIERLVAFLDEHDALGQLKDLSDDFRKAAIRNKHGKQLLVAMREATEGPGFDAIIEDEFRKIGSDTAQRAYLATCGFYQHGTYLRDELLARCLGLDLAELFRQINTATEGVIVFDAVDEFRGIYGARARHRAIAEIVWIRCGNQAEKEQLLRDAISHLNLNFGADKSAFEQLVRADVMVDSIRSLDGKIVYFDTACRKDPDSPYVRQHYARMLAREGKFELALLQIDEGIRLNPRVRVLYHTKGKILSELTAATDSDDVARRYQTRAEAAFRQGLQMYKGDEYCYQGLAELYFKWSKRAKTESEAAEYLARAEGTISEGMRHVRGREALRVVSAHISEHLGNRPEHVRALETAVREAPNSIVARYLLGRTYRKGGDPARAAEVLKPLVIQHPEEVRACVELARSMLALGEPYNNAIAILRLATLHGYLDPRFIATLGGLLFLNGEFSEAQRVFDETLRLDLTPSELTHIEFRPHVSGNPSEPLVLAGKVAVVKGGYAFIEAEGYPLVFSPGSKWSGLRVQRGLPVEFELVFSAKGAQAERLVSTSPGG